jgi:hypothetical protein
MPFLLQESMHYAVDNCKMSINKYKPSKWYKWNELNVSIKKLILGLTAKTVCQQMPKSSVWQNQQLNIRNDSAGSDGKPQSRKETKTT